MEDLTDAITSLKCLLEEHFNPKEYHQYDTDDDSIALTIRKLMKNNEKYLIELTEAIDNLNETMHDIAVIQKRALKWQEMIQ